jgi:hypothetical protein
MLLPFTAFLYTLMTVDSAVRHHRGVGAAWKGRTYGRPGTPSFTRSRDAGSGTADARTEAPRQGV